MTLFIRKTTFLTFVLLLFSAYAETDFVRSQRLIVKGQEPSFREIAPGVEYMQLVRNYAKGEEGSGPWVINLLQIDMRSARLKLVHALDEGVGLETVSSMTARHGAVAGTNGGYFRTSGEYRGESVGTLMLARKLISEPNNERASLGILPDGKGLVFGHLKFSGRISIGSQGHKIDGLNRPLSADELVIFTPEFHRTTLTTPEVVEVVIRKRRVVSIRENVGSRLIPDDGYVISATGSKRSWILKHCRRGKNLNLALRLEPVDKDQKAEWSQVDNIVGGGPQLIKNGHISITNEAEKITAAFVTERHPRTAIAQLRSGKVLLITVDGRQPEVSVGMSLPALAELLLEFGAIGAINLDGGGSTTMVVSNKVVNHPSDQTGERPVSDAILIYSRPH